MIRGVGTDIQNIQQFEEHVVKSGSLARVFLESELRENEENKKLAAVFAAKEAFIKARGRGMITWHEICVEKKEGDARIIHSSHLKPWEKTHVSISYTDNCALAFVIIENGGGD